MADVRIRSMALGRSLVSAAVMATLLLCSGCATGAKNENASYNDSGPPSSAASTPSAADGTTHVNSCSAPASSPRGSCSGCSVNCGDKPAFCVAGEEWPSGGPSCQKPAVCECH